MSNTEYLRISGARMNALTDRTFDAMLASLDCSQDRNDAKLIAHWQDGVGYRLQVTRKADGAALSKLIDLDGNIRP